MIGTTFDNRYRILKKVGKGGMGEVYLAEHIALGRREVLKILLPDLASDPEFVARFRREARATNRVQHPNIVSVYDFGRLPDGRFYLSMEYADGERLDAVLRRVGPLPVPRVLYILGQLADAVYHAHERGVVHRDLKPENMVLVEYRGQPDFLKVLDFGIAKIVAPDHAESGSLSERGQVFGSPSYMSPEQVRGGTADPRSDIYSIGCVAFELLTGAPPFLGRNAMHIMNAHRTQTPARPSERRPNAGIPSELDAVVLRCLEKGPVRRFPTGADLRAALQRVPGYKTKKAPVRYRSPRILVPPLPSDYAVVPDTQESPMFVHEVFGPTAFEAGDAYAPTIRVPVGDDAPAELRTVIIAVAERLSDLGVNDADLIVGVADLRDMEDKLVRDEGDLETLGAALAAADQAAREREGSLRFALGELRYAKSQAVAEDQKASQDFDGQIRELERRLAQLAAEAEHEQTALVDRIIALTAARETALERLDAAYDNLERLVDRLLPIYERNPAVAPLVVRLRDVRALLR